jgi:hypothetical protein
MSSNITRTKLMLLVEAMARILEIVNGRGEFEKISIWNQILS